AGKDNPASEVLDLEELLRDLPDWVDPDHQHEFVFGDYLPRIQVPATAFQQIIMNLVSNAIKHHDKDRGRIEIQCERVKSALNISIIDDGPGIPQQFHQRIFRMFETLKRRDEVEASGIGLAIVERLVRSINGAISVHSKDGQRGTRFMVTIPASVIVRETNNDSRDA
ncbi:MAG: sensor histidine kinase, partial [Pseudomonadota bacterium]